MRESVGKIHKIVDNVAVIFAPCSPYIIERQEIKNCLVTFDDGRTINAEQRKKAHAIIRDISLWNGDYPEYIKEEMKYGYMEVTGENYFSLADCTVTTAREFINYLIDFCFMNNIPTRDTMLNRTDDISHYLYSCLANRKCCICNEKAEVHHVEGSRIGMGFSRRKIDNEGRRAIALCRKCHSIAHNDEFGFFDKYHVYGIPLDKYLIRRLKL